MIVRELITRLGYRLDEAGARRAEQATDRIKSHAESAASAVRNIFIGLASTATLMSIVRTADAMQSLRARIGMLPQTVTEVGEAFDMVADHATKARTSVEAYGSLYVRLAGATSSFISSQEDVLLITDAISQALVVGGAAATEAEAATLQLSQAFQKGKLDGDEFRSFMENLSSDFKDKLAKELGTTKDKFFELSASGELTTRELAEAFRRMAPEIEKQMLSMPMTFGQATTIIGNRWAKMVDRVNRKTQGITTIANYMIEAFDRIERGIGRLVDALGGFENAVRLAGAALVVAFGAKALQILAAFRKASLLALWPFIRMAIILTAVTLALEDLYVWIQGGDSVIGDALGPWTKYRDTVQNVIDKVKEFGPELEKLAEFVGITAAAYVALEIALKVVRGALILWNAIVVIATGIQAVWNAILAANPIIRIILAIIALVAVGVWLVNNWQTVKDWFSGFFDWMASKFEWLLGKVRGLGAIASLIPGLNIVAGGIAAYDAMKPSPRQMTPAGTGQGRANVTSTTNVNLTVPPGTSKEQAAHVKRAADVAFSKPSNALARDIANRGGR